MKTALVLGCNGQDGSLISHSLLGKQYEVIGLSRNLKNSDEKIGKGVTKNMHIVKGSILDQKLVTKTIEKYQPNEIYNLACQSSVGKSFHYPKETIDSIINGSLNLLEICKKLQFPGRIFFAGSGDIYGNTLSPASINHNQNPLSPYAIAKQGSFNLVKSYREIHNLKCCTGILFNHESHLRNKNFVTQKIILGAIECTKDQSRKITLGNINISRDWGWAPEFIEGIQLMTNASELQDQIICTGKLNKLETFINIAFEKLNLNWQDHIESSKSLFRYADIQQNYGNPIEMYQTLNWKAKVDLEEIIERLIDFHLRQN